MASLYSSKFGLGSQSQIKINAAEKAIQNAYRFNTTHDRVVIPVKSASGVNEQPFGHSEILKGLLNRLINTEFICPGCEYYIAMENGIFQIGYDSDPDVKFFDIAYVGIYKPDSQKFEYIKSEPCEFPAEAVYETMEKPEGFEKHTVGKTLMQKGLVKNHADPHIDLCGKSRELILENALYSLLTQDKY